MRMAAGSLPMVGPVVSRRYARTSRMRIMPRLQAIVRHAAWRPLPTVAVVLVIAAAGAVLALGLKPTAATSTFVSSSSVSYQATQQDCANFGGNAVVVLVQEPLKQVVGTTDILRLSAIEACYWGEALVANSKLDPRALIRGPSDTTPCGGARSPCARLKRMSAVQVAYGPATFLNRSAVAINGGIQHLYASIQEAAHAKGQEAYDDAIKRGLSKTVATQLADYASEIEGGSRSSRRSRLSRGRARTRRTSTPRSPTPASCLRSCSGRAARSRRRASPTSSRTTIRR